MPDDRMVEWAHTIEHGSRSDASQQASQTHIDAQVYVPTDDERRMLDRALADLRDHPVSGRSWGRGSR